MRRIEGGCHCGNFRFVFHWPGEGPQIPVRACQCSFCMKHGGVWTSHPQGEIVASVKDSGIATRYRFGTGTADFHVCSRCGAVPLATCEIDGTLYAVVNVNTFEGVEPASLVKASADFDGEDVGERLARRKRNWIARVSLA